MVKLLMLTEVPVIAPPVPASKPRLYELTPSVIPAPNTIPAPTPETPPLVVSTVLFWFKVTPPVPKLITSPELLITPPRLDTVIPVKFKPPSKANVSPPLPRVTRPVFKKSTFATKLLLVPVMLTEYGFAVVIKSSTLTTPVKDADAALVMVKLLMLTVVPVIAPPVPAFRSRLKELTPSVMPAPKVIAAPFAKPPAVVLITDEPVINATVLLKSKISPEVATFTPAMVAALATVKGLSNKESLLSKVTPVPLAVNVVIPFIVPPPETAFTAIMPEPAAVMSNEPAAVMKSSSASFRLKPEPAVPK